jgi:hypothetical protein
MSAHAFALTLVCGAALLALWILARYVGFGPHSIVWALLHVAVACVLLRLLPFVLDVTKTSGLPAVHYIEIFGFALPLFVYAFLSGGWVARAAVGMLKR